jgi:hypothetical protein
LEEILQALDLPEDILRKASYGLVDFTLVEILDLTGKEVQQIVARDRYNAGKNPTLAQALIAPADLSFGMGRMYAALSERGGWATNVFRDRRPAEEWLRETVDPGLAFEADYPLKESWERELTGPYHT